MPEPAGGKNEGHLSGRPSKPVSDRPVSNRIAALIFLIVVVLAPLPFGSVDPLPIVTWCMALGAALCLASLRGLDRRHLVILAGATIVIGAYLLVLHEQVSVRPLFPASLPDPVWQTAADALGSKLTPSVSMVRDQPLLALGAPLAAILSLLVGFIVCVDRDHAHRLIRVLAWSGAAYAVYGIAAFFIDPGRVLWMKKEAYFTVLTSTFINRNTAAVYFGSCVILWLLLLLDQLRRDLPPRTVASLSLLVRPFSRLRRDTVIGFGALFVCLIAMFLTGSRAGVMLSLLAAFLALGLFVLRSIPLGRKSLRFMLAVACVVAVLTQVLGAGVLARFDSEGFAGGGRPETYRSTVGIIRDHPWLGTGLGTFAWVFPGYRSSASTSWGVWDRAHSTPLEIASEMGLPLAAMVAVSWLFALAVLAFGLWSRKRDHIVIVAALAVASLGILHSLIDFSLQIPGFAIVVFALVGAGLAQSFRNDRAAMSPEERPSISSQESEASARVSQASSGERTMLPLT